MKEIQVSHDDDALAIMAKVNEMLLPHGLRFEDDEQEHEGFCVFNLKGPRANEFPMAEGG